MTNNPKHNVGVTKVPTWLVPRPALIYCSMAMLDGAIKYGPYNWRESEVVATIYVDAIERHLASFLDGEEVASDSGVPHLAHIMACCAILLDAQANGKLQNDLPTCGASASLLETLRSHPLMTKLKENGYASYPTKSSQPSHNR